MKQVSINRFPWCVTYNLQDCIDGQRYRDAFNEVYIPSKNPLRIIKELIHLPIGVGFLTAFKNDKSLLCNSESEYFRINSHRKRHFKQKYSILVPNSPNIFNEEAIRSFQNSDEERLSFELNTLFPKNIFPRHITWKRFLSCLEASALWLGFPPAIISYLNFVDDFAVPTPLQNSSANQLQKGLEIPVYQNLVRIILSGKSLDISSNRDFIQTWNCKAASLSTRESSLIRIALFYTFSFTRDRRRFGKFKFKCAPGSDKTYLQTFPRAYDLLAQGQLRGKLSSTIDTAVHIIRASGVLTTEHPNSSILLAAPRQRRPDFVDSWTPIQLDEALEYPLNFTKHNNLDIQQLTNTQIAKILVKILLRNCLIRFDALSETKLSDFDFNERLVEWRIISSKGKEFEIPFPLSVLCPDPEVQFVRDAIPHFLRQFSSDKKLLKIAQIKTDPLFKDIQHLCWLSSLSTDIRSHMARSTGISWLIIRAICLHSPDALKHPVLDDLRDHPWFASSEILKLSNIFPSTSTDAAEIIRLLVGWETKQQLFQSYFRLNHILLRLHADLDLSRTSSFLKHFSEQL